MSEIVKYNRVPNVEAEARRALEPGLFGRAHLLIGGGFLVIMAGIVIPVPESFSSILDIGWIVTVCLTAAVLLLSIMAKNLSELSGFASFVVAISLIKLGLAVASVKSIIIYQSAGSLIEKTGVFLLMDNLSVYAVVIPVAVFGCVVMIFMAVGGVIKKTAKYASDTLPFKYISAEADLNASVISESQAADIKGKIKAEADFFLSMSAAGRFLRFDAIVNLLVVFTSSALILRSKAAGGMGGSIVGDGSVEVNVMLTLGLWAVIFLPGVVLAFSSSSVVNKKNLRPVFVDKIPDGSCGEVNDNEFELLNPDFVEISDEIKDSKRLDIGGKFKTVKVDVKGKIEVPVAEKAIVDNDICSGILELIVSESKSGQVTALLCAEKVEDLAVSTAVNIGVALADRGKKCLLIDADATREAVYKVFDIDGKSETGSGPFDSFVEGLAVWSVGGSCKEIGNELTEKILYAGGDYDCVIIYAPRIEDSAYYGKLAGFVNVAGFATGSSDNAERYIHQLKELLASADCKCIVGEIKA